MDSTQTSPKANLQHIDNALLREDGSRGMLGPTYLPHANLVTTPVGRGAPHLFEIPPRNMVTQHAYSSDSHFNRRSPV